MPLAIDRPAAGMVVLAETAQASKLAFKFAYSGVKTAVLDVDLVLLFDDGSKIILPGLALRMLGGDAPRLLFLDGEIDPQMVIARVDEVQLADQMPNLMVSASLQKAKSEDSTLPAPGIPVVQLPSLPLASLTPMPQFRSVEGDSELNSSLLAPQIGRFARRSNQEDAASTGSGGGQTDSNNTTPSSESEKSDTDAPVSANLAPRIISDGGGLQAIVSVFENNTAVTTVKATDPDDAADIHYSIIGGSDQSSFNIDIITGDLQFVLPPDFELMNDLNGDNVYELTVIVTAGTQTDTQNIRVIVINQNEVPIITSDGSGSSVNLT